MSNPYQAEGPDWHGLYGSSRDDILRDPASVSHPAKMSLLLLKRIIDQMQEWGWLRPGSCLVDPFAGTFSTGLTWTALHPANRACGIELEGHFVAMGRQNQAHAEKRLGRPLNLTILRGDSRHVAALLAGDLSSTRALVAKERVALEAAWRADWSAVAFQPFGPWRSAAGDEQPGYAAAVGKAWVLEEWGDREGMVGGCSVSSPPFADSVPASDRPCKRTAEYMARYGHVGSENAHREYGTCDGQIGNLPDLASVSSPPYASTEVMTPKGAIGEAWQAGKPARETFAEADKGARRYGRTEGQVGGLPDPVESAAIASPPYGQGVIGQADPKQVARLKALTQDPTSSLAGRDPNGAWFQAMERGYGASEGNIDCCGDAAACGSPPYADAVNSQAHGIDWTKAGPATGNRKRGKGTRHEETFRAQLGYQQSDAASIGSPPYEGSLASDDPDKRGGLLKSDPKRRNDRTLTGNYQGPAAVSSPPYGGACAPGRKGNSAREAALPAADRMGASCHGDGYGEAEGQLERLPDAAVSSPPYAGSLANTGRPAKLTPEYRERYGHLESLNEQYGDTPGQISECPDACATSPPFEAQSGGHPQIASGPLADPRLHARHAASRIGEAGGYGENEEAQIGIMSGSLGIVLGSRGVPSPLRKPRAALNSGGIDTQGEIQLPDDKSGELLCQRTPTEDVKIAGSRVGADVAESAGGQAQIDQSEQQNITGRLDLPKKDAPESKGQRTLTGKAEMDAGAALDGSASMRLSKNETASPASGAVRPIADSEFITSSPTQRAEKLSLKTSSLSAIPVTAKPIPKTASREKLPAKSAEHSTSPGPLPAEHVPQSARPPSTPPSTTDGRPSSNEPQIREDYGSACLAVYQGLADAGVRYVALVTKDPTRKLTGVRFCACKERTEQERPETVILGGNRYVVCAGCQRPVRREGGELRRLGKLTARLLRQAGYRVVAWRRANLFETAAQVEERHGQAGLFEDVEPSRKLVGRLSFFRRLSIRKGSAAAAFEDVFFAELVGSGEGAVGVASPPYGESVATADPDFLTPGEQGKRNPSKSNLPSYGTTPGQIASLPDTPTERTHP